MEVVGNDISKYGVIIPSNKNNGISGLVEKPEAECIKFPCISRYVLTRIFLIS